MIQTDAEPIPNLARVPDNSGPMFFVATASEGTGQNSEMTISELVHAAERLPAHERAELLIRLHDSLPPEHWPRPSAPAMSEATRLGIRWKVARSRLRIGEVFGRRSEPPTDRMPGARVVAEKVGVHPQP